MLQIARNVADAQAGALSAKRYLIINRDAKYSEQFRRLIRNRGTKAIRLPPMSSNLNAYAERFVRSIEDERLNRIILLRSRSARDARIAPEATNPAREFSRCKPARTRSIFSDVFYNLSAAHLG